MTMLNRAVGWGISLDEDPIAALRGANSPTLADYRDWLLAKNLDEAHDAVPSGFGMSILRIERHAPFISGPAPMLMLIPPARPWMRRGDELDAVFEAGPGPDVRLMSGNPPGYTGQWMHLETGERLNLAAEKYRAYLTAPGFRAEEAERLASLIRSRSCAGEQVFATAADVEIIPYVPAEARLLAEFLGVFKSPADVLRCSPVRSTWWD